MKDGWWAVLVTAVIGGMVGLLLNGMKEWLQRRERVNPMLLDWQVRCYTWADDGKRGLVPVSSRVSAHVLFIDLDLRWVNSSPVPITLQWVYLVLRTETVSRRFLCLDREREKPFTHLHIPPGGTSFSRLSVRLNRWEEEEAVYFTSGEVRIRLGAGSSRNKEWSLRIGCLPEHKTT